MVRPQLIWLVTLGLSILFLGSKTREGDTLLQTKSVRKKKKRIEILWQNVHFNYMVD